MYIGVGGVRLLVFWVGVLPFRGMADYRLAHQFHSFRNPNFVLVVRMYLSDVRWIGESVVVALVVVSYLGTWQ